MTSPVVAGLRATWEARQKDSAGWRVQAVDADGGVTAPSPAAIRPPGRRCARLSIPGCSISPSGGGHRASCGRAGRPRFRERPGARGGQNAPADRSGPIALTGLYPPGSTFKTVTTMAALQSGAVKPTASSTAGHREHLRARHPQRERVRSGPGSAAHRVRALVQHHDGPARGRPARRRAAEPGARVRLGVDYVTPGLTTVTGSVPSADTPAQRVEAAIGQGENLASPFGMAMVAAAIARGSARCRSSSAARPPPPTTSPTSSTPRTCGI